MIRQKSYQNNTNSLYLVPTPIGNFSDMTYRAVEVLKQVDIIYCEDTRVTKNLLSHFDINTRLSSYHIFNEQIQINDILENLREGKNVALVTDAGTPGISDPGYLVVNSVIKEGFNLISLPGACAVITALVGSGLPLEKFTFVGFLPSKSTQRVKELTKYIDYKDTLVFYEAPHRIMDTLKSIYDVYGNRYIVIARELTKKFEEYIRGNVLDIIEQVENLKGEIVLMVEGAKASKVQEELLTLSIKEHFEYYINQNMSDMEAIKKVASDRSIPKNEVYKIIKTE